jgi:hypothetical protein
MNTSGENFSIRLFRQIQAVSIFCNSRQSWKRVTLKCGIDFDPENPETLECP